MLRKALLMLALGASVSMMAKLTPQSENLNFGVIDEAKGNKSERFYLVNDGSEPLSIVKVRPSCNCMTATFFQEPIQPGETGWVEVEYNPAGRVGDFQKGFKVFSSDGEVQFVEVVGRIKSTEDSASKLYPEKAGKLRLSELTLMSKAFKKEHNKSMFIKMYNMSDSDLTPVVVTDNDAIVAEYSPVPIPAWGSASLGFFIDIRKLPAGTSQYQVKLYPDGEGGEAEIITLNLDIEE